MSAEIAGFEGRDLALVSHVDFASAAIQVETGVEPALAYNNRGAEYAAKIIITALRMIGSVSGDIDESKFIAAVDEIEHRTLPAGRVIAEAMK